MKDLEDLQESLTGIVGAGWISAHRSHIAVRPRTSKEVSEVLKLANQMKIPVIPRGGGTGWWSNTRPADGGILIDMGRMNGVLMIDEDAMTVRTEAGITFSQLESALSPKGYRIVIFPESGKRATVGGHIQTWGTSPYSSSVFDDQATQIVGLKMVLPTGEIVPTGAGAVTTATGGFGRRFFPSDLTGLFIGAEGALGIITEAVLKIYRLPEIILTRMIGFCDLKSAIAVLRNIQDTQRGGGLSTIAEQRFMPKESLIASIPRLKEGLPKSATFFLAIRADGDASDVRRHMALACEIGVKRGGIVVDDEVPEWWEGHLGLFETAVIGRQPRVMLVTMVPFGILLKAAEWTEKFGRDLGAKFVTLGYPFEGIVLFHVVIPCKASTPKAREEALASARKLMEALMDMGCVPHRIGTDFLPVLLPKLNPAYFDFVKRMKDVLDPNRIMHPGVITQGRTEDR